MLDGGNSLFHTPTMEDIRAAGAAGYELAEAGLTAHCGCVREKPDTTGQLQVDIRGNDKITGTFAKSAF